MQLRIPVHSTSAALLLSIAAATLFSEPPVACAVPPGLKLKTPAFPDGGEIPKKFTCDGGDASPQLVWEDPPPGRKVFALIVDDPDAPSGMWVHWVVFNLPATARALPESVPRGNSVQGGGSQGRNDFPQLGYGGPCPPPGKPHRYFFKLYALDAQLNLMPGATKSDLERAMQGHVLAKAQLVGRYQR